MALKYRSIGLPSTHVVEILSIMDEAARVLGVKISYPSYVVRDGKGWQPNYATYKETLIRPIPKLCWKSNLILLEAERMIVGDKVDVIIIPKLITDRFRPCVGANGLITLIQRQFPGTATLSPEFFDEEKPTRESMNSLMTELGGSEEQAKEILEQSVRAMAFEKTVERDANKFVFSPDFPTIGVISHHREIAMLARTSKRYNVNFLPLRELADEKGVPSNLALPNRDFSQTADIIRRANTLYRNGDMDALLVVQDPYCVPRKLIHSKLSERLAAPLMTFELDEFDFQKILREDRLKQGYEVQLKDISKNHHYIEGSPKPKGMLA